MITDCSTSELRKVINANVEALEQGITLISAISDTQFINRHELYISSTIGQHFRHVLDMYHAVMAAEKTQEIDYDVRSRGSHTETVRLNALSKLQSVVAWLKTLQENPGMLQAFSTRKLRLKSEVSLNKTVAIKAETNLLRELVFVSSHTVHHYALINVIARLQNIEVDQTFGVAPATISFLKNEAACAP